MNKKWLVKPDPPEEAFKDFPNLSPLIVKLLYTRGITLPSAVESFFNPNYGHLNDPFLFKDMEKAVTRIWQAINNQEKIVIHGDYDADGVTSSSILFKTLKLLGAQVEVFLPHREEDGYGINMKNIPEFVEKYKLLITVDCGITNLAEVEKMVSSGLDVIVTDHHEPLETLPNAFAIINPKVKDETYPFRYLCGAGVAYKVATALTMKADQDSPLFNGWGGAAGWCKWLLDLAAIGTVADMMPLIGENRVIVKYGLKVLAQTRSLGLQALEREASLNFKKEDTYTIAFQLAPRLNAAGRMHHADLAFKVLTTEDENEAMVLATELNDKNLTRQKATDSAISLVKEQIQEQLDEKMLFVFNEGIPSGIVGLIAGRLSDEYYRPVMVMTKVGEQIVGSGRSIENFDITGALFTAAECLARYGGHPQACGFTLKSLEHLEQFKTILRQKAGSVINVEDMVPIEEVDAMTTVNELTLPLMKEIEKLYPFGEGNFKPRFWIKGLKILAMDKLGNTGKHLRIMAKDESVFAPQKFMAFGMAETLGQNVEIGDEIELIIEPGVNEWNGYESVEARIVEWRRVE